MCLQRGCLGGQLTECIVQANHCKSVKLAVIQKLLARRLDGSAAYLPASHARKPGNGGIPVADSKVFIRQVGNQNRKNLLNRGASSKFRMINIIDDKRVEVY